MAWAEPGVHWQQVFSPPPQSIRPVQGLIDGNWKQVLIQVAAIAATMVFAFGVSWLLAKALKATMGLRVKEEEEAVGLDISQHGENAYGGVS